MKYTVQMNEITNGTPELFTSYSLKICPQGDLIHLHNFKSFIVDCKNLGGNSYSYRIISLNCLSLESNPIMTLNGYDFDNVGCMRFFMSKVLTDYICDSLWSYGAIPVTGCIEGREINYTLDTTQTIYSTVEQIQVAQ